MRETILFLWMEIAPLELIAPCVLKLNLLVWGSAIGWCKHYLAVLTPTTESGKSAFTE